MNYLEFAIKMELDGEKYYREQAEKNKENILYSVFIMLAEDERSHAEILRNKANELSYELKDSKVLTEYENVFESADDFESEIKAIPDQLDVYKMALKKEEESIELYEKMLSEAANDSEKTLFKYLIEQEKTHYAIFDELISHLSRAEEWVESAEFGLRDEY